ncbi:TIGR04086 family membrane protein [Aquihabitans daechungensis]|uniref:TIGR04086 family membrane protein n=1 Tax=Aquihabitans daechungensis TaxID=1052257 RepID=UPI003BA1AA7C
MTSSISPTATHATHRETAAEAGLGRLSIISLLAGLVTAYGTFAVVAAIAGSLLAAADVDTEFRTNDWTGSGAVASLTAAIVLFVAYLFGGYVAGRMARRSAVLHGVALAIATLVVGAVAGGIVAGLTDDASIRSNLRAIGVPTATEQVTDVAIVGVIVSLAAIFLGSIAGATLGERWHTKLARRVDDPEIGASAAERRRLEEEQEDRRRRIVADPTVAASDHRTTDGRVVDLPAEEARGTADQPRYTEAEWRQRDQARPLR